MVLASFIMSKMHNDSKAQLRASVDDEQDGVAILRSLIKELGGTNVTDATNAKKRLEATKWEPGDTISTFNSRFLRRTEAVDSAARTSRATPKMSKDEKLLTFLTRLCHTMPQSHPLYQTVQSKLLEVEGKLDKEEEVEDTIMS